MIRLLVDWAMPRRQIKHLVQKRSPEKWATFRDNFMKRWTTLNIVSGLIMGAISTVLFSSVVLSDAAFAVSVVSLLSSLISIGFGTGLMYVLGDLPGESLSNVGQKFPGLFSFALAIPQVWATISFSSFFAVMSIYTWEAVGEGWAGKAGMVASAALVLLHLFGFVILFRSQDFGSVVAGDECGRQEKGVQHELGSIDHEQSSGDEQ